LPQFLAIPLPPNRATPRHASALGLELRQFLAIPLPLEGAIPRHSTPQATTSGAIPRHSTPQATMSGAIPRHSTPQGWSLREGCSEVRRNYETSDELCEVC